jgi:putative PIN family toxin of toxin-antitoxin system
LWQTRAVRVVLDTNVLISACLKPDGLEAAMVEMGIAGRILICVTDEVWAEYREVLFRAKFHAVRARAEEILDALENGAERVRVSAKVLAAADEDDNRFLECAQAAKARYLVTGNLKHYPAEWNGTRVVNARGFMICSTGDSW